MHKPSVAVNVRYVQSLGRYVKCIYKLLYKVSLGCCRTGFLLRHTNIGCPFREADLQAQELLRHTSEVSDKPDPLTYCHIVALHFQSADDLRRHISQINYNIYA